MVTGNREREGGAKTFEAQIAGTRDQTKDSKLRATFRPLAKQSGKNEAIILVVQGKINLSPGNSQIIPDERILVGRGAVLFSVQLG